MNRFVHAFFACNQKFIIFTFHGFGTHIFFILWNAFTKKRHTINWKIAKNVFNKWNGSELNLFWGLHSFFWYRRKKMYFVCVVWRIKAMAWSFSLLVFYSFLNSFWHSFSSGKFHWILFLLFVLQQNRKESSEQRAAIMFRMHSYKGIYWNWLYDCISHISHKHKLW